jgi:regulator of RNase E activity RraA
MTMSRALDGDSPVLSRRARQLGCAALVDAMGRLFPHRAHLLPMTSPDPSRPLFGPAATVGYLPFRQDTARADAFGRLFHEAVAGCPPAAVLVLSSGGYPDESHGGGVKLTRAVTHHLGGILADGRLRDFADLRTQGLPVWCRGEAVRSGGDVVVPALANVPIEVGGVRVCPGDFVYVDSAGGVVIPAASVEAVLDAAQAVADEDLSYIVGIRNGAG